MYKVDFYTLGISKKSRKVGNIKMYSSCVYTEIALENIEKNLIVELNLKNYFPVITNISKIKGSVM